GAAVQAWRRSSPNEWAENAPQPNRTSGRSAKARGTIDVTGSDAGRQSLTYTALPQVPGIVAQGSPARPANQALHRTAAAHRLLRVQATPAAAAGELYRL